jgi:hypothetical protein
MLRAIILVARFKYTKKKFTFVMQPYLINSLEETFGEEVVNLHDYETAGTPRCKIIRPNDNDKIESEMQLKYK